MISIHIVFLKITSTLQRLSFYAYFLRSLAPSLSLYRASIFLPLLFVFILFAVQNTRSLRYSMLNSRIHNFVIIWTFAFRVYNSFNWNW